MKQLIHWSSFSEPPPDVVRGLRAIDPTAELLYLRNGKWSLGSVRWNRCAVEKAERIVGRALSMIHRAIARSKDPNIKVDARSRDRLEFALLGLQGYRHIAQYQIQGSPDSYIVRDFQVMDYLFRHTSDDELFRAIDAPIEHARAESRKDLTDPARGKDAWKYAFTLSHLVSNGPARVTPWSSARTRVLTLTPKSAA